MKIDWKAETKPFMELLAAILLSFILVLGTIHNVIKPFWDYRRVSFVKRLELTWNWYKDIVMQSVHVLFYVMWHILYGVAMCFKLKPWGGVKHAVHEVARGIDLLGNVLAGEMIEDFITPMEKTYFGLGEITISAAIGYVEHCAESNPAAMNKLGWIITKALNKSFNEEKHSVWSWEREIRDHAIYGHKDFLKNNI